MRNQWAALLQIGVGIVLMCGGFAFAIWLPLWAMLYGGIMQAIDNWGVDNGAVVRGIIRAVLFEVGVVPGYLAILIGLYITKKA